jgi:endoglucanase
MKKQIKVICTLLGLLLILIVNSGASAKDVWGKGYAFKQNARLGRGVNILGADPRWRDTSKTRMTEKHFKLIKEAGFDNVRIVIKPFKFSMNDANYTIDPNFFITLDWAVKQALKNKLMAIIDFHEHGTMSRDPLGNKAKFLSMWKQIAEHCKGYPNKVLFEVCNEPNMKDSIWNQMHGEAYKIMRKSNPDRTLIIGTINGNQIKYLQVLTLPEEDRNIIVAVHYYMPIQFTHQGAPFSAKNKDLSGITWTNSESEEKEVNFDFDMGQEWSKKYNRPLTLGEFGAYEKADMASRVRWDNYIARQAEARKWSWSYWQLDSDFVLYNIDKDEWVAPILGALIPKSK